MKLSICSGNLQKAFGKDMFRVMKECGFDACDLNVASVWGMTDGALRQYCERVRALADEAGIVIGQTHAGYQYPRESGNDWKAVTEQAIDAIRATSYLGAPFCIVHPARFPGRYNHRLVEENYRATVENYKKLIPYLEEYQVVCCLENMWDRDPYFDRICGTILSRADELVRMCDELNAIAPGRFGICVDTGHCELTQDPAAEMLRLCGSRLKALHCHDTDGISDLHTLPFSIHGAPAGCEPMRTDWEEIMGILREIGYEGTLNFEVYVPDPAPIVPAGLRYLGKIGQYLLDVYENGTDVAEKEVKA